MNRDGFTLVEALVALLVFAMIAAAGASVLGVAVDNRVAIKSSSDRVADLQRMDGLLRADLGQASARRTRGPTGRPIPQPIVGPQQPGDPVLVLARGGWSNPDGRARPSVQRVEYRVVEGRLERRAAPQLDGARPGPAQVLYRGVRDVQVAFLRDGMEAPAYAPTPDRPLPDAVKLTMVLDGYGPVDLLYLVGGA